MLNGVQQPLCDSTTSAAVARERLRCSEFEPGDLDKMAGSDELKTYLTCLFFLYIKFMVAIAFQSAKSFEGGTRPAEDRDLWIARRLQGRENESDYGNLNDASAAKAREEEQRWRRIIQNDLESMPLALLLFGAGVFAGGNKELYEITMVIYTISRCFHTLAYAGELQPHRAIAFCVGVLSIVVGAFNSLVGVYKH